MTNKTFYNEILIDHNMHPGHKHDLDDANMVMEGLNPTCGDHIWLKLLKMIKGTATEEEIESLEEASALEDIAHMPARVKCAVLGWHTMEEMLKCDKCSGHGECSHCDTEG